MLQYLMYHTFDGCTKRSCQLASDIKNRNPIPEDSLYVRERQAIQARLIRVLFPESLLAICNRPRG